MELFTILLTVLAGGLIYYYFSKKAQYFKKLGVPYEPGVPILGNMASCLFRRTSIYDHMKNFYDKFSRYKYFGFYNCMEPVIIVRDLELIQDICVKNFEHFIDHPGLVDEHLDPLVGKNLFSLRGDNWRDTRKLLSPAFTSSKMKMMYELINECAANFTNRLCQESKDGKDVDIKDIFCRYANDVVATCAFGISVDSMKDPENEFYKLSRSALRIDQGMSLRFVLGRNYLVLSKIFGLKMFSENVTRFFQNIVKDAVTTRDANGIVRPDMIQLMMDSRGKGNELTFGEMTSQAFVFFVAGFDATSTAMCFIAHEIATNPDVQMKLREEIDEVMERTNGKPTYEAIAQMKYMEAVLNETLRLYPLAHVLTRICVKEYELPPAAPGGKPVKVAPGTTIWASSFAIHRDPNYFSNPEKFDPERFLNASTPPYYMPFGMGPRMCIGNRFALMESKVLMFYLLHNCELSACSKTTVPMRFDKANFAMMAENGFWLKIRPRSDRLKDCQ